MLTFEHRKYLIINRKKLEGRGVDRICGGRARERPFEAAVERWLGFEEAEKWRMRKIG